MKSGRIFILLLPFFFSFISSEGPLNPGDLQFPINPGQTNLLAGSMGELRRNHFHGGIDIKTGGRIGVPVFAAADGYVSRISISPGGYGRRLNVTHAGGYFTVYGHLDRFAPLIEARAFESQYQKESFSIDLFPNEHEFPVKKGEVIGFSGNSGYSAAPHLHFEIRDPENLQKDPLEYGFDEIVDSIPPRIQGLALVSKGIGSHVLGYTGRREVRVFTSGASYVVKDTLEALGWVGFEFRGYDKMNESWNQTGIQAYQLLVDDRLVFKAHIKDIPVLDSRMINLHANYEVLNQRGRWYHRAFVVDGNTLPFYDTKSGNGWIKLDHGALKKVVLTLFDSHGNASVLEFFVKGARQKEATPIDPGAQEPFRIMQELHGSILKIQVSPGHEARSGYLYSGSVRYRIPIHHFERTEAIYLWDLNVAIPDSLVFPTNTLKFNYCVLVPPSQEFSFFGDGLQLDFFESTLYDTLFLSCHKDSQSITLGDPLVPLKGPLKVSYVPNQIPESRDKTHAYLLGPGDPVFLGGRWEKDKLIFSTQYFGRMGTLTDTTPPTIRYLGMRYNRLKFKIADERSGVHSFRATLDDAFLLMEYEAKTQTLRTKRKDETKPLKGTFVLSIKDQAGNENKFELKL